MAAAVSVRKPSWGLPAHEVITMGMAVNRSCRADTSSTDGFEPRRLVTAPTRISGAASPSARASDSTVPVRIPGAA